MLAILIATMPTAVFFIRGSERGIELSSGFEDEINANAFDNTADVRIMSSNLWLIMKTGAAHLQSPEQSNTRPAGGLQARCYRRAGNE